MSTINRSDTDETVIEARNLVKTYGSGGSLFSRKPSQVRAIDGVSFSIRRGEVLGLVGESGCGKSTTGMALMLQEKLTSGEILFDGSDVLKKMDRQSRLNFCRQAQLVFQNPYEALNPRYTVGESISEPIKIHFPNNPVVQRKLLIRAMERSGLLPPENFIDRYPHQMSGGQLQRVAIARGIAVEPKLLIADEPVAMLDVSIRASVLNLFRKFADELGMAILYISHDLSTMRYVCSTIAVMYMGQIVETGPAEEILDSPRHPYTKALVAAVPTVRPEGRRKPVMIEGVSNILRPSTGCRFQPRCPEAMPICAEETPALKPQTLGCSVACHLFD